MELMEGELLLMLMMMSENQSSLSQVQATAILGTDESLLRTPFNLANHACQREGRGRFSPSQFCIFP
jgi:hypothetical protein